VQRERYDSKPPMPEVFQVLRTSTCGFTLFNADKRDVGKQRLVDNNHRQVPVHDRLDSHGVVWHGIDDQAVNCRAPDSALVALPTLQEQQAETPFTACLGDSTQKCGGRRVLKNVVERGVVHHAMV
jgi:hypothetical protein